MKNYTVKQHLEGYGSIYLDLKGQETNKPVLMTEKRAIYLADYWGGYVVEV